MALDVITAIGTDRYLTVGELTGRPGRAAASQAWETYTASFSRFTSARLDPQFARLDHPARAVATPHVSPGTTVVVAGTGPSLAAILPALKQARHRLSLWTSPRGAETLQAAGIRPDLVLVQHQSDLDAFLSARQLGDRNGDNVLDTAAAVLAEPKTPACLLARVEGARLAAVDPAAGWGLWPATLVSLAMRSGAGAVALAGIDLGATGQSADAHAPLVALLDTLARGGGLPSFDVGQGADKPGWPRRSLDSIVDTGGNARVVLQRGAWLTRESRLAELDSVLRTLADPLAISHTCRQLARDAQRRLRAPYLESQLADLWTTLLAWRRDPALRTAFQEGLGVRFLPRFWRLDTGPLAGPLWRPVLLATEEITLQARAARRALNDRAEAQSA